MNRAKALKLVSAGAFLVGAQLVVAAPGTEPDGAAAAAAATRRSASLELRLSDPALLIPKGFAPEELQIGDDFLHRAVAYRRVELVRFVDSEDRRVFLGLTRDGYLGIHVQRRDRR
jgi:hypothetical protein